MFERKTELQTLRYQDSAQGYFEVKLHCMIEEYCDNGKTQKTTLTSCDFLNIIMTIGEEM